MAVEITHVRLSATGVAHEHITDYRWRSLSDSEVNSSSKATMVDWIDNRGGTAYVGSGDSRVDVAVVRPQAGQPYLRTHADGFWNNNLLNLPRF